MINRGRDVSKASYQIIDFLTISYPHFRSPEVLIPGFDAHRDRVNIDYSLPQRACRVGIRCVVFDVYEFASVETLTGMETGRGWVSSRDEFHKWV